MHWDILLGEDVLDVFKVLVRDSSGEDYPIELIGRDKYSELSNKNTNPSSIPSYVWIDKQENSRLYLYPFPINTSSYTVHIHAQKIISDILTPSANPDMPIRYYDMLVYNLAELLADEYGLNLAERNFIAQKAYALKVKARGDNVEDISENVVKSLY